MIRPLYDWTMRMAGHRHALWWLAAISFVESSVFPIPPDIMLIPMILARPNRAFLIAAVCTVASVLGGVFGYLIGYGLLETVGRPILELYGQTDKLEAFQKLFEEYGWWMVIGAGVTPFPYKVITIASGAAEFNLVAFIAASLLARGLRFFVVAALLWKFGPPIRAFVEERMALLSTLFFILLIGGFVAVRFLF